MKDQNDEGRTKNSTAQVFPPSFNAIAVAGLGLLVLAVAALGTAAVSYYHSPYGTGGDRTISQPIPFSHAHHVDTMGIDCRYCHASVEVSSFAGIPTSDICMNCHAQIWAGTPLLRPVRESAEQGEPIRWNRVHNLADFVYFNHSIHVAKGVGCVECHGRVDLMPQIYQAAPLTMKWCLDCHRNPQASLRPREEVTNMAWLPPPDAQALRERLQKEYDVQSKTSCTTCHR